MEFLEIPFQIICYGGSPERLWPLVVRQKDKTLEGPGAVIKSYL